MKWQEVREHFPHQWLLVEAMKAHSVEDRRVIDDLAVVDRFPDGQSAMRGYSDLHRDDPMRELYVLHTDRENLEITELRWLGIREAPWSTSFQSRDPAVTDEEKRLLELGVLGLVAPRERTVLKERERVRIAGKPLSETVVADREDRV